MVSANVNRVLEETRRLTLDERRQLLVLLSAEEASSLKSKEELDAVLARNGIVLTAPRQLMAEDRAQADAWRPVPIVGKPLSETILEERPSAQKVMG